MLSLDTLLITLHLYCGLFRAQGWRGYEVCELLDFSSGRADFLGRASIDHFRLLCFLRRFLVLFNGCVGDQILLVNAFPLNSLRLLVHVHFLLEVLARQFFLASFGQLGDATLAVDTFDGCRTRLFVTVDARRKTALARKLCLLVAETVPETLQLGVSFAVTQREILVLLCFCL